MPSLQQMKKVNKLLVINYNSALFSVKLIDCTIGKFINFVGNLQKKGYLDGDDIQTALFDSPRGICYLKEEYSIVVFDYGNNRLRKNSLDRGNFLINFFIMYFFKSTHYLSFLFVFSCFQLRAK